jgi:hypothetical protein
MKYTKFSKLLLLSITALIATACGGGSRADQMNLPKWFIDQPPLCGVGVQKIRGNTGSAKSFAEANARDDLSRQLETRVKSMIKQYNQEGGTEDGDISEELSTKAALSLSKQTINGSVPKQADIIAGEYYALVCLEPDALTNAINNMKTLKGAQRKALARRAAVAHEELKEAMENYDR